MQGAGGGARGGERAQPDVIPGRIVRVHSERGGGRVEDGMGRIERENDGR